MNAKTGTDPGSSANLAQDSVLALLEPRSKARLAALAGSPPPQLSVLWGPQPDLVDAAAVTLGGFWIPKRDRAVDLVVAEPAGRWSVEQIREVVLGATRVAPLERRVVVVCAVADLGRDSFDMLLKTIEQPPPGTVFVLTTNDPQRLPRTVAGRVGAEVEVRPLLGDARRRLLVEEGWSESDAELAVGMKVPARWLRCVRDDRELLEGFRTLYQTLDDHSSPARSAALLTETSEQLARKGKGHFGNGDAGERAARRVTVDWILARLSEQATMGIHTGDDAALIELRLDAIEQARDQLAGNASLGLVLTVLLTRTSVRANA
jgi:hypothetical protein